MGWITVLPAELKYDDIWGEAGRLCIKEQNEFSPTWYLIFCPHEPHCGEEGDTIESAWHDLAPLRVLRLNEDTSADLV